MLKRLTIVDYGIGNIFSVEQALKACGSVNVELSADKNIILNSDGLILPGVGAFDKGMAGLKELDLVSIISEFAQLGKPILGICLGAQMLASVGEEFGLHEGLNLIPGNITKIQNIENKSIKIPSIGWVKLDLRTKNQLTDCLFDGIKDSDRFYVVHSFHYVSDKSENILASYNLSGHAITALIGRENVIGAQFHPEKSSRAGLKFLSNFLSLLEG
jgi:glutamine amidotransferase